MRSFRTSALVALMAVMIGMAGCSDDGGAVGAESDKTATGSAPAPGDLRGELEHIHGLGVEPGSGRLFVATHYGLFEAAKDETQLQRMGTSRQDIMGFAVAGPQRYIGSGHPDPSQNLPPNLGLIESRDGGKQWKNVSLLGEADFHVLRTAGQQVYGFNSSTGKLMVSRDGGRKWTLRTPPAAMFDLAIDPDDNRSIVASTERGIFASSNAGKRWRPLDSDSAGLLSWPSADRLFLVDGQGQVARSADAGKTFDATGGIGAQPSALTSNGDELLAALGDGKVVRSLDGGANWKVRATP